MCRLLSGDATAKSDRHFSTFTSAKQRQGTNTRSAHTTTHYRLPMIALTFYWGSGNQEGFFYVGTCRRCLFGHQNYSQKTSREALATYSRITLSCTSNEMHFRSPQQQASQYTVSVKMG
jgi:hypothetical protein